MKMHDSQPNGNRRTAALRMKRGDAAPGTAATSQNPYRSREAEVGTTKKLENDYIALSRSCLPRHPSECHRVPGEPTRTRPAAE